MDNTAIVSVQEQKQLQLLNNGLITADRFINKNYLINISEQNIVPLDDYEKTTNSIRLFQIIKLVYDKTENINDYKVGVNISGDIDCLKYVFSTDIISFLDKAKQIIPNVELVKNNEADFDMVITVKNRGYDSSNFKTLITVKNKKENTEDKYYVSAVNEFKEWNIEVLESKPKGW